MTVDHGAVVAAMAVAGAAKRSWLAMQDAEPSLRHNAADEYERARRAALRAVDEWIDKTAASPDPETS